MDQDVDAHFAHRFYLVEENLLDSITDHSSLAAFNHEWMALVEDVNAATEANTLSYSTILAAHSLAQMVAKVVQTFLDLDTLSESLMSSLALEASSILSGQIPAITPQTSDHNPIQLTSAPSYIKPSYEWLLRNIHDPYPSIHQRENIARETGSSRKDVDGWFVDARKRIKWNALRKTRFSNKRIGIVDAATRFFVENRSLDSNIEVEFIAIQTRARALYSEKFSESDLAAKLDVVVKDMTPEMKVLAKEERRRLLLQKDKENMRRSRTISSYPSPDRSPNRSPEPDLPTSILNGGDAEPVHDEPASGRKRRNPDLSDYLDNGPNKRFRLDVPPPDFTGLPSPASSFHEDLEESDLTVVSMSSEIQPTSLNRKRRLSDADVQGAPKRPRNLPIGPRLHAVSDPLPMSSALLGASAFDSWWFNENLEFPRIDGLDASVPVEVELCDTSVFDENALRLSSLIFDATAPDTPPHVMPSSVSPSPSLPFDVYSSEFDFPDLTTPHDFTHSFQDGQGFSLPFNIPPLDLGFPPNAFDPYTIPLPDQNLDISTPSDFFTHLSTNPTSDANWSFSQFLSSSSPPPQSTEAKLMELLNVFPSENFLFDPIIPSQTKPDVDVVDTALADRAAKEKQLLEMKEAARRLEEELEASRR